MAIVHPISLGVEWDVVKSSHFIQHQRKVNTELSVEGVDFYISLHYFEFVIKSDCYLFATCLLTACCLLLVCTGSFSEVVLSQGSVN